MKLIFVTILMLFPINAISQSSSDLKYCRAIADNNNRLSCFDRLVKIDQKPNIANEISNLTFIEFMTDSKAFVDKNVSVSGFGITAGELFFLYRARGEMSAVIVDISKLDREGRKLVYTSCGSGCEIAVNGSVTNKFGQIGITAKSVQLD
jgi:hypothetical protein